MRTELTCMDCGAILAPTEAANVAGGLSACLDMAACAERTYKRYAPHLAAITDRPSTCPRCGALTGPFERLGSGVCNACLSRRQRTPKRGRRSARAPRRGGLAHA